MHEPTPDGRAPLTSRGDGHLGEMQCRCCRRRDGDVVVFVGWQVRHLGCAGDGWLGAAHHGRRFAGNVRGSRGARRSEGHGQQPFDWIRRGWAISDPDRARREHDSGRRSVHAVPTSLLEQSGGGAWLTTLTFKQDDPVPSLSFNEGILSLLLPGDDRLGEPRPSCTPPATVVATLLAFDNTGAGAPKEKRVGWAVPDDLVAQLNAAPQPS